MTRVLRYFVRALIGLIVLLLVLIAAVTIYLRTASFNQLLLGEVNATLHGRFRGRIVAGAIRTPRIGLVEIDDVTVTYDGRELLAAPSIAAGYALIPILWHQVDLTISINNPEAEVARQADGKWDLAEALESTQPKSGGPSTYAVTISALQVSNGTITVAPNGLSQPRYHISAANLDARVALIRSGVVVTARRLSAHLQAPKAPPADLTLAAAYDATSRPATIKLSSLTLATQNSSLSAAGALTNPDSPTIDAHVTIEKLAPADLTMIHGYPLRDDIAGSITISGPRDALHAIIALSAGRARMDLDADADLIARQPTYHGRLNLADLDLGRLAIAAKLAGQLNSSMKVDGAGTNPDTVSASIKADGRGIVVNQIRAGDVNLVAEAKSGSAQLAATMRNGASEIRADAAVTNFTAPAIRARILTRHLNAQTVMASRAPLKTDLNATLALDTPHLDRSSLNLPHLEAHALLTIARSMIRNVVIADGVVDAGLRSGVVNLARMNLNAQGAAIDARGRIGLIAHSVTQVTYAIRAPRLMPLLQIAQIKGDGSLDLLGTADGVLVGDDAPSLRTQGRAEAARVNVNGVAADSANASYDLNRIGNGGLPLGRAQLQFGGVAFGTTRLRTLNLTAQLTRQKPAALNLALALVDAQGHPHSAALNLATQGANVAGTLTELSVTAPDGVWRLAEPARFVAGSREITINEFDARNGTREIALHGTMRIAGPQNVAFSARDLDLVLIQPLMQANQHPAGTINADVAITGTAAAPIIRANMTGQTLSMNQQRIGDLNFRADYSPGAANLNLTLYQDKTHQMALTGTLPMTIDWARGFHVHLGNNAALRLYSAGLKLGGLAALAPPRMVTDATGQLKFDLAISGPPPRPIANGTLTLDNLGAQIVPLGLRIQRSFAHMRITPERFTLEQMVINGGTGGHSANSGSINASGGIALNNYLPGAVDLSVKIEKFPAIHTQQYQATIGGALHLGGTPNAPDVTGQIEVLNGTVRPDLAFLTATKYSRDTTIVVIRPGQEASVKGSGANGAQAHAPPVVHSNLFDQLAVNVAVIIHRNTWIRHPDASVELAGHVQASKQRGGPLSLIGEIDTVRGWITFNNQTFTLVSGQILFTGGRKIDPSLNIDAQYTVSNYIIDVLVTGFASKPKLKLQSTPPLPQSDILSLLLFGKTSSSLGQSQSASLQQQAAQMAAGAAASTIGQSLATSLGLENLGVDVNTSSGNGVGIGRYIGKNTYLSASQSTTGRKVSIQYYVRRWVSITTSTDSDGSSEIFLNLITQY
jgi:autotransporter translocation and assembly factor TamB